MTRKGRKWDKPTVLRVFATVWQGYLQVVRQIMDELLKEQPSVVCKGDLIREYQRRS